MDKSLIEQAKTHLRMALAALDTAEQTEKDYDNLLEEFAMKLDRVLDELERVPKGNPQWSEGRPAAQS